jgi:hypothetical protein
MPDKTVIAVADEGMAAPDGLWLTRSVFRGRLRPQAHATACAKIDVSRKLRGRPHFRRPQPA